MEIYEVMNQLVTPSCLPQIPKNGIWGRGSQVLSPIFVFWKWGKYRGGQFAIWNEFTPKKHFILEFQVIN